LRDEIFALKEENLALKEQLQREQRWEQESARYELKEIVRGITAYRLKQDQRKTGEPEHWLCAACFHDGKKSILQFSAMGSDVLDCPLDDSHRLIIGER
jgi:hypothetical protein